MAGGDCGRRPGGGTATAGSVRAGVVIYRHGVPAPHARLNWAAGVWLTVMAGTRCSPVVMAGPRAGHLLRQSAGMGGRDGARP
jgi:hypothetical protein